MNKVELGGRLTKDVQVSYAGETVVSKFTIACDRRFKKDGEQSADFISCVAFGKVAEFIEKYFKKGSGIYVTGRIQTGNYTNKDGQKVFTTDVVIEEAEFPISAPKSESNSENSSNEGYAEVATSVDEELPFR